MVSYLEKAKSISVTRVGVSWVRGTRNVLISLSDESTEALAFRLKRFDSKGLLKFKFRVFNRGVVMRKQSAYKLSAGPLGSAPMIRRR